MYDKNYPKNNNYHRHNYRYNMNYQNHDNTNDLKRKQDARRKIMLGGLVIKAGLEFLHPNDTEVLYGMLLANKKLLKLKPEIINYWRELGKDLKNT